MANVIIVLVNKIIEVINDANVKGVNCVSDNINDKKNQEIALEIVNSRRNSKTHIIIYS